MNSLINLSKVITKYVKRKRFPNKMVLSHRAEPIIARGYFPFILQCNSVLLGGALKTSDKPALQIYLSDPLGPQIKGIRHLINLVSPEIHWSWIEKLS